ncbi:hypothetical protein ACWGI9_24700 [Streptomyces sp. NPDC054833]
MASAEPPAEDAGRPVDVEVWVSVLPLGEPELMPAPALLAVEAAVPVCANITAAAVSVTAAAVGF